MRGALARLRCELCGIIGGRQPVDVRVGPHSVVVAPPLFKRPARLHQAPPTAAARAMKRAALAVGPSSALHGLAHSDLVGGVKIGRGRGADLDAI